MLNHNLYRCRYLLTLFLLFVCSIVAGQADFKKMVWADEFNYNGLPDSLKWSYDIGNGCPELCGWGNNELQYYTTNRLENARVENGTLIIETRKEQYAGLNYTSARLVSKNKGDWKYGRFEIKAKLPSGTGMWSAVWMLPTNWEYGKWPHSGETDIMENVGYWPDSVLGTVHTGAYNGMKGTQKTKGLNRKDLSTSFHIYALEWNAETVSFFVDAEKYHVFKNDHSGSEAWPYDKTFYLLLNIAVGGDWGGKFGVDDKIFPQKMEIDYIRVYQ